MISNKISYRKEVYLEENNQRRTKYVQATGVVLDKGV